MDKKSIVNDLYQAAVISVLAVGYSMLGKMILKMAPPSIQKFDLEDTGKLVVIAAASEMTREYLIKQKILPDHICIKMASIAMLIGGALVNALAFTGSSYLFHRLSVDSIDVERKRHDAAIEALQKAQMEWANNRPQRIDFINNQLRLECTAETKFTDLNNVMREYHEVFGHKLPPLPREPVLSDFYTPTDEQHYRTFIALSMIGIGGVLYYFES